MTEEKDVVTHRSTLVPGGLSGGWEGVHSLLSFCGHHPFLLQADLVPGTGRVCLRVCVCRKCSAAGDPFLPRSDAQVSEPLFFKHLHRCRLDKTSTPTPPFCSFPLSMPALLYAKNTERNKFDVHIVEKLETIEN